MGMFGCPTSKQHDRKKRWNYKLTGEFPSPAPPTLVADGDDVTKFNPLLVGVVVVPAVNCLVIDDKVSPRSVHVPPYHRLE